MITKYENMWKEFAGMIYDIMPNNIIQIVIYDPQTEKGRIAVIAEDASIPKLAILSPIIQKMLKKELHVPLIISKFFIETSRDSFPLEFFNIQSNYQNLYVKKDLIKELVFNKADVRLQMEREVKSKILLTRLSALENLEQIKNLYHLIDVSVHSLIPVMKGFMFLTNKEIPYHYKDLFKACEDLLHEDLHVFFQALSIHEDNMMKDKLLDFFNNYTNKLMSLMYIIEKFDFPA
jgi:hypothetical protein